MASSVAAIAPRRGTAHVAAHGPVAVPDPTLPTADRARAAQAVVVQMVTGSGDVITIGTADEALRDRRLTAAERRTVANVLQGVALLQRQVGLSGANDAGQAVRLLLRSGQADTDGPFAEPNRITVGTRNPFDGHRETSKPGVLLPVDAAVHELVHVIQFARLGRDAAKLHAGIAEGMADAASMLATRDFTTGEGFFRRSAGRSTHSVRSIAEGDARVPGEPITSDYRVVRSGKVEVHSAGGVVSRTFQELQRRIGWEAAQALLWAVVRDPQAWVRGGSWTQLVDSIDRNAAALWPGDPTVASALEQALAITHLDEARSRRAAATLRAA